MFAYAMLCIATIYVKYSKQIVKFQALFLKRKNTHSLAYGMPLKASVYNVFIYFLILEIILFKTFS